MVVVRPMLGATARVPASQPLGELPLSSGSPRKWDKAARSVYHRGSGAAISYKSGRFCGLASADGGCSSLLRCLGGVARDAIRPGLARVRTRGFRLKVQTLLSVPSRQHGSQKPNRRETRKRHPPWKRCRSGAAAPTLRWPRLQASCSPSPDLARTSTMSTCWASPCAQRVFPMFGLALGRWRFQQTKPIATRSPYDSTLGFSHSTTAGSVAAGLRVSRVVLQPLVLRPLLNVVLGVIQSRCGSQQLP